MHVQRFRNPWCYRLQVISLTEMIKQVLYRQFGIFTEFDNHFQLCIWPVKMSTKPPPFKRDTHYNSSLSEILIISMFTGPDYTIKSKMNHMTE